MKTDKKSELWLTVISIIVIAVLQALGKTDALFIGAITTLNLAYIGGRSAVKGILASKLGLVDANSDCVGESDAGRT